MARVSLFLGAMALGGPACLVTSTPDFQKPKPTPPVLTNVFPETYQVHPVDSLPGTNGVYPEITITFVVQSEDLAGPGLIGFLLEDFKGFGNGEYPKLGDPLHVDLGHVDSPVRKVEYKFRFDPGPPGCHSATLVLTHAFRDPGAKILVLADDQDVATVTWWFALDTDDTTFPLSKCFIVGGTTLDAGSDAADGGAP